MLHASQIDVRAVRDEYTRTHTSTGQMSAGNHSHGTSKIDVTDDEAEFGAAIDRYKRENRRPLPTYGEVLAVLHALGYRRVEAPGPLRSGRPAGPAAAPSPEE